MRIVFVHGAAGGPELWVAVARKLQQHETECVALPGHRDGGPGRHSVQAYAAWLAERLEQQAGPSLVAGSSLGGAIALTLGLERPDLLGGLALVGCAARLRVSRRILASLERDEDYPAAAERLAGLELAPGTDPRTVAKSAALIRQVPREVALGDFRACDAFDLSDRLGEIDVPALVAVGEHDAMTPVAQARELAGGLPQAQLVVLPRAGHLPMVERPRPLADALARFAADL